jgi:hypothetical protein
MIRFIYNFLFGRIKPNKTSDVNDVYCEFSVIKTDDSNIPEQVVKSSEFDGVSENKLSFPYFIQGEGLLSNEKLLKIITERKVFSLKNVPSENKDYYHKKIYRFRKEKLMNIIYNKKTQTYTYVEA